ncbi:DUF397 domain-containing protein [Streptomyces sp. NBC_01451]|uniref:DUF397 domain-containing protein n=1 Tax=Streptomyces sp. NBC_01451 TaxID=2903872 RepID=UPI002E36145D|nr:DUF397 domain-containing protein [Streptomyces sp. NBC_01451]
MPDNNELKNQTIPESAWVKSSFSGAGSGGDCVEVARLQRGRAVRDSKNPSGPKLFFTDAEWSAFTQGVQAQEPGLS